MNNFIRKGDWLLGFLPYIIIILIAIGIYYASKESPSSGNYPEEYPLEQYCGPGGSPCQ